MKEPQLVFLSTCAWRGIGSPSLVLTASQLLAFDRRTCVALGILTQTPVTLGGKTVLVDFMVIEDPLDLICSLDVIMSMPCKLWCQHSFM